jgi:hypothetical protein
MATELKYCNQTHQIFQALIRQEKMYELKNIPIGGEE